MSYIRPYALISSHSYSNCCKYCYTYYTGKHGMCVSATFSNKTFLIGATWPFVDETSLCWYAGGASPPPPQWAHNASVIIVHKHAYCDCRPYCRPMQCFHRVAYRMRGHRTCTDWVRHCERDRFPLPMPSPLLLPLHPAFDLLFLYCPSVAVYVLLLLKFI